MRKRKLLIGIILSLALVVAALPMLTACSGGSNGGKTIKIGISTPSTGVAAEKGRPMEDGQKDAIEYINNELGGVNGYKLDVVWRDNGYDGSQMSNIVRNFMDAGCVMFSTSSSAMMTAAMGLANQNGFPGLAAFSSPNLYRPPQHIYGQLPDYGDDFVAFMKYYMENVWTGTGKPKVAIEALNNSTGQGAVDAAHAFADQLGITVLWDGAEGQAFQHKADTISETEALTRIKAMNPDVLFIASTPAPTALIIKNARELGMDNVTIACGHAAFTSTLVQLAGTDANNVYGVYPTVNWGDDVPGMAKVVEYATKNHPQDVGNGDYITAWAQSMIMAKIIETALNNGVSYDTLSKGGAAAWKAIEEQGIQKLSNYDVGGLHGPVSYAPGDNRLAKSVRVFQIQSGVITTLTGWIEAPVVKYEDFSWFGQ
jgi:branched-chain amino acid transport system substrate-binding protein